MRTPLGGVVGGAGGIYTIGPVNVPLGTTLLLATLNNNALNTDLIVSDINGNALGQTDAPFIGSTLLTAWTWVATTGIVGGTITVDYTGGTGVPTAMVALAIHVSVIAGAVDSSVVTTYAAATNPNSGYTAVTPAPSCFLWGLVGTNGMAADMPGTWTSPPLVGGQRYATALAACDLKESCFGSALPAAARAKITGQTSRATIALAQAYL